MFLVKSGIWVFCTVIGRNTAQHGNYVVPVESLCNGKHIGTERLLLLKKSGPLQADLLDTSLLQAAWSRTLGPSMERAVLHCSFVCRNPTFNGNKWSQARHRPITCSERRRPPGDPVGKYLSTGKCFPLVSERLLCDKTAKHGLTSNVGDQAITKLYEHICILDRFVVVSKNTKNPPEHSFKTQQKEISKWFP